MWWEFPKSVVYTIGTYAEQHNRLPVPHRPVGTRRYCRFRLRAASHSTLRSFLPGRGQRPAISALNRYCHGGRARRYFGEGQVGLAIRPLYVDARADRHYVLVVLVVDTESDRYTTVRLSCSFWRMS